MFDPELVSLSALVLADARARGLRIVTAESCTGGLVGGVLTEIAGSSDVFERGFITYSNEAKMQVLGVPAETLRDHGAVSEATVRAMASGGLVHSQADISVAVTGIAGPGGGVPGKPVGLVHFAAARRDGPVIAQALQFGDIGRTAVRLASVKVALEMLRRIAG